MKFNESNSKQVGFLNIFKPSNCTSHDVIYRLRKKIKIQKLGHSGTLDPMACGVLVIGINDSTRLFEYLNSDKEYIAEIKFGIKTDTDDITGNILNSTNFIPSLEEIKEQLKLFIGNLEQKPPLYSAIKIKGQRAYKLAKENLITKETLKVREVKIYSIEIISFIDSILKLKINCSSGTYIRSIARDLGENLNSFGTLFSLQRTKIGMFKIEDSINLENVDSINFKEKIIHPSIPLDLTSIKINSLEEIEIKNGRFIPACLENWNNTNKNVFKLLNENNDLIAIGRIKDKLIKPLKVFQLGG